jgi:hypothetical protein
VSRAFGKIAQIGYVVRDIDAAMYNWLKHGVGPWFYVDRVQTDYFRYRGVDSDMQMSVALANSGDVQLEQGTVFELSDISGPKDQFFQYIRGVAADWDGSDPIRGRE